MNFQSHLVTIAKTYQGPVASHIFTTSTMSKPPLYLTWTVPEPPKAWFCPVFYTSPCPQRQASPRSSQGEACVYDRRQTMALLCWEASNVFPALLSKSWSPHDLHSLFHFQLLISPVIAPQRHPTLSSYISPWGLGRCSSLCQQLLPDFQMTPSLPLGIFSNITFP